jgi:beta-lactamase superfamily II metal-dependent hydrolase
MKTLLRLSAFFLLCGLSGCGPVTGDAGVALTFLDVGQGDAIVIQSPEGNVALIDAGNDAEIVPLLQTMQIEAVDLVIASHVDFDHTGGIASVIRTFPVRYYMDNGMRSTSNSYDNLMWTLQQAEVPYVPAVRQTIEVGSVNLTILPPPGWNRTSNDESIGVLVEYGEFRALLTGDSQVDELNYFLDLGVPKVTVLKAAHHGARNGVTPRWLDVTRPDVVVISCGANNAYGHPDPWALRFYEAVASEIYRTDLHGHVGIVGQRDGSYEVGVERGVLIG